MPFEGAFSPVHWLIIAVVALLVLGPERLPDAARKFGRAWRQYQGTRASLTDQISNALHPEAFDDEPDDSSPPDERRPTA
jgi:Tat protein translocase TatB subunit